MKSGKLLIRDNPEPSLLIRKVQRLSKAHQKMEVSRVHSSEWKCEGSEFGS
nr:MAG TPA: hypothetical protein [Caudoviricetes sp.]